MMRLRRPVPAWFVLVAVLATASIATGLVFLPGLLPDFQLSLDHNPMAIQAGGYNATRVRVDSVRNFSGIVSLEFTGPEGLSVGWSTEGQDKILLGKTGTSVLDVRGRVVGNYVVTVTASSGSKSHSATFLVWVQNLTVTSNVSSLTIARGSSGTAEVSLSSVNGLEGDLVLGAEPQFLSYRGFPVRDWTMNASITPSTATLEADGTLNAVLTVYVSQDTSAGEKWVFVQVRRASWTFGLYLSSTVV